VLLAGSQLWLTSDDVPRIAAFFRDAFGVNAQFENEMFADFVLSSRFRVAFFKPAGASATAFRASADRAAAAFGLTVSDVDATYRTLADMAGAGIQLSGPPKSLPWGEKSFLVTDQDGNRWEIAQTPSDDGMLVDR
jgi:uncharacterized glyoxalase superfamily protein PhnB